MSRTTTEALLASALLWMDDSAFRAGARTRRHWKPHHQHVGPAFALVVGTERAAALVSARAAAQGVAPEAIEAQMAAGNSIRHLVDASEVAFLCSPKSRAINGDVIAAGGGARAASTTEQLQVDRRRRASTWRRRSSIISSALAMFGLTR